MNRFTSMVKGSALVGTFNNLTGNVGKYMSGDAYKGDDEAYQKDMMKKYKNQNLKKFCINKKHLFLKKNYVQCVKHIF